MKRYATTPREDVRTLANDLLRLDLTRYAYMKLRDDAVRDRDWLTMQALTYVLNATYDRVGVVR